MQNRAEIETAHVIRTVRGSATSDGAGVKLTRVIGGATLPDLDPFLLFDEFGTDRAEDYIGGFPEHPHRGFETVTYMLDGRMRHKDNHGNEGLLMPGSVQWMTAGRGLIHSEMPEQQAGRMRGFQLWVNLPAKDKMTDPRYQEFDAAQLPVVAVGYGVSIKIIAGALGDVCGPIVQPATEPMYFDISLEASRHWTHVLPPGHHAFVYVYEGSVVIGKDDAKRTLSTTELGLLGGGDALHVRANSGPAKVLLIAGKPLREPVARHGPFVMNTRQEIMQAFVDFQEGRF